MDFADESYVRLYPRETLTSKLLGWEGRAVMYAMLAGKFDAAGLFHFRGSPERAVSAITDIPIEIVKVGLARLVETETWVIGLNVISWPTYEEAQNCRRSDRERQRRSRRDRASQAVTKRHTVTDECDECHSLSQDVTLPPSAPSHPPSPPFASERESAREAEPDERTPEPEPATPTTRRLPRDWKPTEALYGEAWIAGVPREVLDEDVTYWRSRDLGADVFGDGIDDFFRAHFARLRKRAEAERLREAQQRAGPTRAGPTSPSDTLSMLAARRDAHRAQEGKPHDPL